MARDGSGNYSLPEAAFTPNTTIESSKVNNDLDDIAAALTQSLSKDGQTVPTANIPMGTFRITGLGNGTSDTDAATLAQTTWQPPLPQGRLTLSTGVPVMTGAVTGATTLYYTPYCGNLIPIYDGTRFAGKTFTELSNATAQSSTGSAGPAVVANNSNYDLFVWNDNGTLRLTRGPLWTSDTGRGTGAGTSELTRVNGILLNAVAITNGPAASRGTYVGSFRSDGSAQANWQPGAIDTPALLNVWNMYNRRSVMGFIGDSTNSWNYTTATVRAAGGVNTVRASFIQGMQEDFFWAEYLANATHGTGNNNVSAGIGYDATNAFSGRMGFGAANSAITLSFRGDHRVQALGFHFMQACEWSVASGTVTWYGDNNQPTLQQTGLTYQGSF